MGPFLGFGFRGLGLGFRVFGVRSHQPLRYDDRQLCAIPKPRATPLGTRPQSDFWSWKFPRSTVAGDMDLACMFGVAES